MLNTSTAVADASNMNNDSQSMVNMSQIVEKRPIKPKLSLSVARGKGEKRSNSINENGTQSADKSNVNNSQSLINESTNDNTEVPAAAVKAKRNSSKKVINKSEKSSTKKPPNKRKLSISDGEQGSINPTENGNNVS